MKKLKKEVIVQEFFRLISNRLAENASNNPLQISIPMREVISHLYQKFNVEYHSEQHLYNQMRYYEKEMNTPLFKKQIVNDTIYVSLKELISYKQRVMLHVPIKLALAHGAFDLINDLCINKTYSDTLRIYLGAGSECYYLAQQFFNNYTEALEICTHNLAVIQAYCEYLGSLEHIKLYTRNSSVDKNSLTQIMLQEDYCTKNKFDVIIQSPRHMNNTTLYSTLAERKIKSDVALNLKGIKLAMLTLFEFIIEKNTDMYEFADITQYDYLITPSKKLNEPLQKYLQTLPLEKYINYYSYDVYKIQK